jgi:hypothetical protein
MVSIFTDGRWVESFADDLKRDGALYVAEWPCCHDSLRSSHASHGFVPPPQAGSGSWWELGFPIFRKVLITLDLVESRHNSIRLPNNSALNPAIAAPRPLWLSTGVARSTSPRSLSPCLRIENTRKNTKECNQIADEWLISQSWGLTNWRRRRNCCQQNNLSKTQP